MISTCGYYIDVLRALLNAPAVFVCAQAANAAAAAAAGQSRES